MVTSTSGWAVTAHGVLRTDDGAIRWRPSLTLRNGEISSISSLAALGNRRAWVASATARQSALSVYRTVDGGRRWIRVSHSRASLHLLQLVTVGVLDFVDASHGWMLLHGGCGAGSCSHEIMRTTNGGRTWTRVEFNYLSNASPGPLPACDGVAANLEFLSRTQGWVTGICGAAPQVINVWRSRDGGLTWSAQHPLMGSRPVAYFNPGLPSAFTSRGCSVLPVDVSPPARFLLLQSCNRGASWRPTKPIHAGHQQFGPNAIYDVFSFNYAWARVKGKLYRTTSAMSGWQLVSAHPRIGVDPQLDFVSPTIGSAAQIAGATRVLVTHDAGRTWMSLPA
jgi:photosystem II stability/assembly factor-like uncharacterized protein